MTTPDIEPAAGTGGAAWTAAKIAVARREIEAHGRAIAACEEDITGRRHMIALWEGCIAAWGGAVAPDAPAPSAVPERAAGEEERHRYNFEDALIDEGGYIDFSKPRDPEREALWIARLAQPRPAAEGQGDAPTFSPHLEAAIGILRTAEHAAGKWHDSTEYEGDDEAAADADAEANAADRALRRAIRAEIDAAPGRVDAGAVRAEATFLLDRLAELSDDEFTADGLRDFYGHVSPSASRLRDLLSDAALAAAGGDALEIGRLRAEVERLTNEADGEFVQAAIRIMSANPGIDWRDYQWEGITADDFETFFTEDMAEAWNQVEKQRERADKAEAALDAALAAPSAEGLAGNGWRPIGEARKNRTAYLLKLKDPIPQPGREDLRPWDGLTFVGRHPGLAQDGFDIGWQFAAPVGYGGFPDEWFEGFRDLSPAAPTEARS